MDNFTAIMYNNCLRSSAKVFRYTYNIQYDLRYPELSSNRNSTKFRKVYKLYICSTAIKIVIYDDIIIIHML